MHLLLSPLSCWNSPLPCTSPAHAHCGRCQAVPAALGCLRTRQPHPRVRLTRERVARVPPLLVLRWSSPSPCATSSPGSIYLATVGNSLVKKSIISTRIILLIELVFWRRKSNITYKIVTIRFVCGSRGFSCVQLVWTCGPESKPG